VWIDQFCKRELAPERRPGPAAALSRSEVLTLAAFGQWARFGSERDFWRYAEARLRPLFPTLPDRSQFNRHLRRHAGALAAFALWLADALGAAGAAFEALDGSAVPTRNLKRRGAGWLPGVADVGRSPLRGWYEGLRLLVAVTPAGVVTGWGVGPASSNDRALAETPLAQRAAAAPALPSAGRPAGGVYVADAGFAGVACEARWVADHGAQAVCQPQPDAARAAAWSAADRTWLAGARQIAETVFARLQATFRLATERPHALDGFLARLAAKVALHNACIRLNRAHARPDLAFADLLGW